MRSFIVPSFVVSSCKECPDFQRRPNRRQPFDVCLNEMYPWYGHNIHNDGVGIPDDCPRLKNSDLTL